MKRVFASQGRAILADAPEPELRRGEVLVATAFSAISSGTEMWVIRNSADPATAGQEYPPVDYNPPKIRADGARWNGPAPRPPLPHMDSIGYSLAGTVLAVGDDVVDVAPGDRVACSGSQCAFHAERVAVPRSLVTPVPDGVSLDQAAFVTLGTITIQSLRQTECHFGEHVVVFGLGLLGLLSVQIARSAGLLPIGFDIDERRVEQARALGATAVFNPQTINPVETVKSLTGGFGADAVVLYAVTSSNEPLNLAFEMCRQRGHVVGVGLFGQAIDRSRMGNVHFSTSIAYGPGRYDAVYEEGNVDYPIGYVRWTENRNANLFMRFLADGKVNVAPLAPIRVPIAEAPRAYELLARPDRPPTVLLTYNA